jgi:hypothetical protein
MPLTPELEALLGKVADPTKREGLRKQLEDPTLLDFGKELSAGYLRQSEFSRKMNEITEADNVRRAAYDKGLGWVEQNRANYTQAVKEREAAIEKAKAAEARAAELAKGSNPSATNTTIEDINMSDDNAVARAIKEARTDAANARLEAQRLAGVVTKINTMLDSGELLTTKQFQDEAGKQLEAYSRATMDVMGTMQRAKSEFGLDLDRDALLRESANYNGDLSKAYEKLTSDARMEKIKNDIRAELQKEFDAKQQATQGNPLAAGAPPIMGPLQQMVYQSKNTESQIDPNIPADGSHRLAHAIAAELRAEGKY